MRNEDLGMRNEWECGNQPDVALPLGDKPVNDSRSEVGVRIIRGKK
jgi:hypothetical protein